jgi:hypothetical protein
MTRAQAAAFIALQVILVVVLSAGWIRLQTAVSDIESLQDGQAISYASRVVPVVGLPGHLLIGHTYIGRLSFSGPITQVFVQYTSGSVDVVAGSNHFTVTANAPGTVAFSIWIRSRHTTFRAPFLGRAVAGGRITIGVTH